MEGTVPMDPTPAGPQGALAHPAGAEGPAHWPANAHPPVPRKRDAPGRHQLAQPLFSTRPLPSSWTRTRNGARRNGY